MSEKSVSSYFFWFLIPVLIFSVRDVGMLLRGDSNLLNLLDLVAVFTVIYFLLFFFSRRYSEDQRSAIGAAFGALLFIPNMILQYRTTGCMEVIGFGALCGGWGILCYSLLLVFFLVAMGFYFFSRKTEIKQK